MRKKDHISLGDQQSYYCFSKTLLTAERGLTELNTWVTDETFQQSEKQDSLRQLLKSSANI